MGTFALRVTGGTKRYHRDGRLLTVFEALDLEISAGEVLALLGPSGCGKSTLLRVLAGLEPLSAGRVEVAERPVAASDVADGDRAGPDGPRDDHAGRPLGIVWQEPLLLPWLTVAENVGLGLRYRANRPARATESVDQWLHEFGLAPLAHAYPGELSGGQAQRVSLARTIITRPAILLLLDEPFAALDPRTRAALQDWLGTVVRRRGLTVVLVTHDVDEALYLGDRVALMSAAPSTIVKVWETARKAPGNGSDPNAGGPASDVRQEALRREILTGYETDIALEPNGRAAASWVI